MQLIDHFQCFTVVTGGHYIIMLPTDWSVPVSRDYLASKLLWLMMQRKWSMLSAMHKFITSTSLTFSPQVIMRGLAQLHSILRLLSPSLLRPWLWRPVLQMALFVSGTLRGESTCPCTCECVCPSIHLSVTDYVL